MTQPNKPDTMLPVTAEASCVGGQSNPVTQELKELTGLETHRAPMGWAGTPPETATPAAPVTASCWGEGNVAAPCAECGRSIMHAMHCTQPGLHCDPDQLLVNDLPARPPYKALRLVRNPDGSFWSAITTESGFLEAHNIGEVAFETNLDAIDDLAFALLQMTRAMRKEAL